MVMWMGPCGMQGGNCAGNSPVAGEIAVHPSTVE